MPKYSQNFLVNLDVLPSIIEAADLNSNDLVLEIGPGKGVLSQELCQVAQEVMAIEIDLSLMPGLLKMQKQYPNLTVYNADFNTFNWQKIVSGKPYKIVANIPYHITGLIIRNIFNHKFHLPQKVVLMVQYEVAKKMAPKEGNHTVLSNLIRLFGDVSIVQKVSKESFDPVPKVDSAIILVDNIQTPDIPDFEKFFSFIKIGFSARRKTLANNLSGGLNVPKSKVAEILTSIDISSDVRAQALSIEQWKKLYSELVK